MKGAVLDANVIVSDAIAIGRPNSTIGQVINAWEDGRFRSIVSQPLIDEVDRNLARLQTAGHVAHADLDALSLLLRSTAESTPLTIGVHEVATHPEDDLILAKAVSAGADCLVTGDKQLLALATLDGVAIVSPKDFLLSIG